MGLVNDIGSDRTIKLPVPYGVHPVQGVPTQHLLFSSGTDTRYTVHQALGEGPWDGLEQLWWRAYEILPIDYEFRNGTGNDPKLTFFPNALDGEHPWASHIAAKLPVGVPSDTDFAELFGIYRTLRIANYDNQGRQIDVDGNLVSGASDPRDHYFYEGIGTNPANQSVDQIIRWGLRPNDIVNWPAWVDWRDWNAENIAYDDAKHTPRFLRGNVGIAAGTVPAGTYYFKLVAMVGANYTSPSREVKVVLNAPGSVDFNWDMKDDVGVTNYRIYWGNITGQQVHWKALNVGGVSRAYNLSSLSAAVDEVAPSIASGVLLSQIPRFELNVFFTPPYRLVDSLDRIAQLSCADWQWAEAKVRFMSPEDRVPIFTFNLAEIGKGTFKTYPPDSRTQPNQIVLNYRSMEHPYKDFADPIIVPDPNLDETDPRIAKQIREGGARALIIEGGVMTHSLAQRVANYWYHSIVENNRLAEIASSPRSYITLPADVALITHDVPGWENVSFKIITKTEKGTKTGDKMTLRLYANGMYSDFEYVPIPSPLPATPANPFQPPPQVQSVTLSETNVLQKDGTVLSSIDVSAQFNPFVESQQGIVYYKKSTEADNQYKIGGTITPEPNTLQGRVSISGLSPVAYNIKVVPVSRFVSAGIAGAAANNWTVVGKATAPAPPTILTAAYDGLRIRGRYVKSVDTDVKTYLLYEIVGASEVFRQDIGNSDEFAFVPPVGWSGRITLKVYSVTASGVTSSVLTSPTTFVDPPYPPLITSLTLSTASRDLPGGAHGLAVSGLVQFAASNFSQRGRVWMKLTSQGLGSWVLAPVPDITPDPASRQSKFEIPIDKADSYDFKVVTESPELNIAQAFATHVTYTWNVQLKTGVIRLVDTSINRPYDDGLGIYGHAYGTGSGDYFGSDVWIDSGVGYKKIGTIPKAGVAGVAVNILSGSGAVTYVKDVVNTVRVTIENGAELLSLGTASDADVLAGVNNFLLGKEKIGVCTISAVAGQPNTFDFSNIFRGLGDTEYFMFNHGATENVLRVGDSLVYLHIDFSDLKPLNVKTVPFGKTLADVVATTFTPNGDSIRPLALYAPLLVRDANPDWLGQAIGNARPSEMPPEFVADWYTIAGVKKDSTSMESGVSMAALFELIGTTLVTYDNYQASNNKNLTPATGISTYADKNNVIAPTSPSSGVTVRAIQQIISTGIRIDFTIDIPRDSSNVALPFASMFSQSLQIRDKTGVNTLYKIDIYSEYSPGDPDQHYVDVRKGTTVIYSLSTAGSTGAAAVKEGERFTFILKGHEVRAYRNYSPGTAPLGEPMLAPAATDFPLRLYITAFGGADVKSVFISDLRVSTIYSKRQQLDPNTFNGVQDSIRADFYQKSKYSQIGKGHIITVIGSALRPLFTSFWNMNEASGAEPDQIDSHPLTAVGSPGTVAGVPGNARTFNGSSQSFVHAHHTDFVAGDSDVFGIISCYLTAKGDYRVLMAKWGSTGNKDYWIGYHLGLDRFVLAWNDSDIVAANVLGSPALNTNYFIYWHHRASDNQLLIQVNNNASVNTATTTGYQPGTGNFEIGALVSSSFWQGRIGMAGFGRTLPTASNLTQLYNAGSMLEMPF